MAVASHAIGLDLLFGLQKLALLVSRGEPLELFRVHPLFAQRTEFRLHLGLSQNMSNEVKLGSTRRRGE